MNIKFMCEALNYCNQRARFNRYQVIINSQIMTVKDSIVYGDWGKTEFKGASQFLTILFYEGVVVGADKDAILLRYHHLLNSKSFVK